MSHPVVRQLRDFAFGAALAIVIATVAFVAVRNHELAERQLAHANRAVTALADGRAPLPDVHAVVVGAAVPSKAHPYLRHRPVRDTRGWRPLVAGGSPNDKLFYDAASRFDRTVGAARAAIDREAATIAARGDDPVRARELAGAFSELLPDGSGRAIAVLPVRDGL
ncbi:MAG: hypothetical protein H0T89_23715, partial [Deltaproteobacteria bacterium]|nr:hypothetical protein [Deltaproteobacteria bacterium]